MHVPRHLQLPFGVFYGTLAKRGVIWNLEHTGTDVLRLLEGCLELVHFQLTRIHVVWGDGLKRLNGTFALFGGLVLFAGRSGMMQDET